MSPLTRFCARVPAVDGEAAMETQQRFDNKTKPAGSLGRLEALAVRYAAIRGDAQPPPPECAIVVLAADHGVASEGVSAYPQVVTRQMVDNFASGGAAVNVLARCARARLVVADFGTCSERVPASVLDRRIRRGTGNFLEGRAMTRGEAEASMFAGAAITHDLANAGVGLVALGEMGIGNSTAASALTAALTGASVTEVTGRGTGLDESRLRHKHRVVQRALERHRPALRGPFDILARLGGFEIAGLVGVALGAAERRMGVVLDGFISTSAGLLATRLCPNVGDYLFAAHRSPEPGHQILLQALALQPILDLGMRLGEGSGAALALPVIEAAVRLLGEMATFDSARVARGSDGAAGASPEPSSP